MKTNFVFLTHVTFTLVLAVYGEQDLDLCLFFDRLDCTGHNSEAVCGTDGRTYNNLCEFYKAHCSDNRLLVQQNGPCPSVQDGRDLVLNLVCSDLLNIDCAQYPVHVSYCATNGRTYLSACHFEKDRCKNTQLHLRHIGPCDGFTTFLMLGK